MTGTRCWELVFVVVNIIDFHWLVTIHGWLADWIFPFIPQILQYFLLILFYLNFTYHCVFSSFHAIDFVIKKFSSFILHEICEKLTFL